MKDLNHRVSIGGGLLLGVGLAFWGDGSFAEPVFSPVILLAMGLAASHEYGAMNESRFLPGWRRLLFFMQAAILAAPALSFYLGRPEPLESLLLFLFLAALFILLMALLMVRWMSGVEPDDLPALGNALLGIFLIGLPLGFLMDSLFRFQLGLEWVLLVVLGCKLNDIGGYLVGASLPERWRHALCPGISPNKSREGALAGLAAGVSGLLGLRLLLPGIEGAAPLASFLLFSVSLSLAAQVSDLFESAIKRSAGKKDSAALLPAFGGVLDMLDSFVFAAPLSYLFAVSWLL